MKTIKRKGKARIAQPAQGAKRELQFTVFDTTADELEELANEVGVSVNTLLHEAMALVFRREHVPLPPTLVEYLETHGRPIPRQLRRKAKSELN